VNDALAWCARELETTQPFRDGGALTRL
jgi:hypothetical protein